MGGLPVRLYVLYANRSTQKYIEGHFELKRKCVINLVFVLRGKTVSGIQTA